MNMLKSFLAFATAGLVFGCSGNAVPEPVLDENQATNNSGSEERRVAELAVELAQMQDSVSSETNGRFIWEKEPRHYAVVDYTQKNYTPSGVQHRTVRAVLPAPQPKSAFEAAAKEIYEQLSSDIENTQPDAQHKRLNILLYDSMDDADAYNGAQVLQVVTTAGPMVPAFDDATFNWRLIDPPRTSTGR